MADINQVSISGRLTKDPLVGQGKVKYAFYSIAINRYFNNSKSTTFVNVAAFGQEADYAEAYLKKGKKVHVTGQLRADKQGKLMVVANEQSVRDNVLYRDQKQNVSETASFSPHASDIPENEEQYQPFTDVASDGLFTPVLPDENELPW